MSSEHDSIEQERWVAVKGYEGHYEVSSMGRVKSLARTKMVGMGGLQEVPERICKPSTTMGGYLLIGLWKDSKCKRKSVHRLVIENFVGPCPPGMQCRHLDGDPTNNRLDNLSWGTVNENWKDKRRHGTAPVGERGGHAKLTKDEVRAVIAEFTTGDFSKTELARIHGVSLGCICHILRGDSWKCLDDPTQGNHKEEETPKLAAKPPEDREDPGVIYKTLTFMGFPNYRVGTDGSFWGFHRHWKRWRKIHLKPKKNGYLIANLWTPNGTRTVTLHTLILEAFVELRPEGMVCRHLDGDRLNNRVENLRWGTYKENTADAIQHGTLPRFPVRRGESNNKSKLTDAKAREIRQLYATGDYSQADLGKLFGVSQVAIWQVTSGKTWRK